MTTPLTLSLQYTGPACFKAIETYLAYNSPNKKDAIVFSHVYETAFCMTGPGTLDINYQGGVYTFMRNGENRFGFH